MRHTLYKITGPDGRCYIGMTTRTLEQRLGGHLSSARGPDGRASCEGALLHAMRSARFEGFTIEALGSACNKADARAMEAQLIHAHRTLYPRGMNKIVHRPDGKFPVFRDWILPTGYRDWPPLDELPA